MTTAHQEAGAGDKCETKAPLSIWDLVSGSHSPAIPSTLPMVLTWV